VQCHDRCDVFDDKMTIVNRKDKVRSLMSMIARFSGQELQWIYQMDKRLSVLLSKSFNSYKLLFNLQCVFACMQVDIVANVNLFTSSLADQV
jgi:hypothetical protein